MWTVNLRKTQENNQSFKNQFRYSLLLLLLYFYFFVSPQVQKITQTFLEGKTEEEQIKFLENLKVQSADKNIIKRYRYALYIGTFTQGKRDNRLQIYTDNNF